MENPDVLKGLIRKAVQDAGSGRNLHQVIGELWQGLIDYGVAVEEAEAEHRLQLARDRAEAEVVDENAKP